MVFAVSRVRYKRVVECRAASASAWPLTTDELTRFSELYISELSFDSCHLSNNFCKYIQHVKNNLWHAVLPKDNNIEGVESPNNCHPPGGNTFVPSRQQVQLPRTVQPGEQGEGVICLRKARHSLKY